MKKIFGNFSKSPLNVLIEEKNKKEKKTKQKNQKGEKIFWIFF